MADSLAQPDRPDAAWCSHCTMVTPQPLLVAIEHRERNHNECISCAAECLLFRAILDGFGHPVEFA